jgi:hypothetical protein
VSVSAWHNGKSIAPCCNDCGEAVDEIVSVVKSGIITISHNREDVNIPTRSKKYKEE